MNIKIASSNLNQIPLDWDRNYTNIKTSILKSIKNNVKVLCLPELSITGYGCQDLFFNNWVIEKAKLELGWQPKLSIDKALDLTNEWYYTHHTNKKTIN